MSEISRLLISDSLSAMAVKAALNRIKATETHTEITTGEGYSAEIPVFTDRSVLTREAMAALRKLPQAEEEDYQLIVQVLASRLQAAINDEVENMADASQPDKLERARLTRDAAHWVILKSEQALREAMFSEIARYARVIDAKPLPDIMVFPQHIMLELSAKNIYGVLPPRREDGARMPLEMRADDRLWLADRLTPLRMANTVTGRMRGPGLAIIWKMCFHAPWTARNMCCGGIAIRVTRLMPCGWFAPSMTIIFLPILWCVCGITRLRNPCSVCWRLRGTPRMSPGSRIIPLSVMAGCVVARLKKAGRLGNPEIFYRVNP